MNLTIRQKECLQDAIGYLDNVQGALRELLDNAPDGAATNDLIRNELLLVTRLRDLRGIAEKLDVVDPTRLYEEYCVALGNLASGTGLEILDQAMGQPYGEGQRAYNLEQHHNRLAAFLPIAQKFLMNGK